MTGCSGLYKLSQAERPLADCLKNKLSVFCFLLGAVLLSNGGGIADECKGHTYLVLCLSSRAGGPWLITDMRRGETIFEIDPHLQVCL